MNRNRSLEIAGLFRCINYVHNKAMKHGYARVSTDGQTVTAQVARLTRAGCKKVFRETASGAKTDRAQLRKVLAALEDGDVLMVTKLDRLAACRTRDFRSITTAVRLRRRGHQTAGGAPITS